MQPKEGKTDRQKERDRKQKLRVQVRGMRRREGGERMLTGYSKNILTEALGMVVGLLWSRAAGRRVSGILRECVC